MGETQRKKKKRALSGIAEQPEAKGTKKKTLKRTLKKKVAKPAGQPEARGTGEGKSAGLENTEMQASGGAAADEEKDGNNEAARLAEEAVDEILASIDEDGGATVQCLPGWHKKYKGTLGCYKKFLRRHCDHFTITDTVDDCFIVTRAGQVPPDSFPKDRRCWRRGLKRAWRRYSKLTPKDDRRLQDFLRVLDVNTVTSKNSDEGSSAALTSPLDVAGRPRPKKKLLKRKATQQGGSEEASSKPARKAIVKGKRKIKKLPAMQ
eukprot:TRINITY_DN18384_c0_g1_i1.p1 TRINITY_DN18384_c0_g1~~TRINITY_DN18384_c0_g1_i1.p1  ORF type:complete len:271 (+),score=67.85 TRINITY_DN18384_c0_g1_i1:26-814(+)